MIHTYRLNTYTELLRHIGGDLVLQVLLWKTPPLLCVVLDYVGCFAFRNTYIEAVESVRFSC